MMPTYHGVLHSFLSALGHEKGGVVCTILDLILASSASGIARLVRSWLPPDSIRFDSIRFDSAADIDYINDRNKHFNKKIKRAYDKYTVEIRQNLERGTAL